MSSAARTAARSASPTTPAATATARSARARRRRDWLAAREADLLPVPYFHVVFTLPAEIAAIAYQNKTVIYDLLFRASSEALLTIAADPQASRRPHRHHRRAPHLGLGDDPPPACPHDRAGRRHLPRRRELDPLPPGLPAAGARALPPVPPPHARRASPPPMPPAGSSSSATWPA